MLAVGLGQLAVFVVAAGLVVLCRGRPFPLARPLVGVVLLFGTLVAWGLGGDRTVHWIEFHESLAVLGALVLAVLTVAVPLALVRPAAGRDARRDSTARSPSRSARSPEIQ